MIEINTDHPITNRAAEVWGIQAQVNILIEECAEVIQAASKYNRALNLDQYSKTDTAVALLEELADVFVCCMSVVRVLGSINGTDGNAEDIIHVEMTQKIQRLKRRMQSMGDEVISDLEDCAGCGFDTCICFAGS